MSTDDPKNGQGRKTLLPEFLPAPIAGDALTPPERVAARARELLRRFRGLGTTAGAAVLSLQCSGYGVVDPLPPPAMSCSASPDPFAGISASATIDVAINAPPPIVVVLRSARSVGYQIGAVRVTGGTLVSIVDMSQNSGITSFYVTIAPDVPQVDVVIEVDFTCAADARTKYYRIAAPFPTGGPAAIPVTELPSAPADAGTD